jgi:hypothetical protein
MYIESEVPNLRRANSGLGLQREMGFCHLVRSIHYNILYDNWHPQQLTIGNVGVEIEDFF